MHSTAERLYSKNDHPPPLRPLLWVVVPCYNEEAVLPLSSKLFLREVTRLIDDGKISPHSQILFIDDGSADATWSIIDLLPHRHPIMPACLFREIGDTKTP